MNAPTIDYDSLDTALDEHPYPVVFATIGGAHLYGFALAGSDLELCGVHAISFDEDISGGPPQKNVDKSIVQGEVKVHILTREIERFNRMLRVSRGDMLEQLYSPLVVRTSALHHLLKCFGKECITRRNARYYHERASWQWKELCQQSPPTVESLLHVYRLLLTGIWLMKTGWLQSNLATLSRYAKLVHLDELIKQRIARPSDGGVDPIDVVFHEGEYNRLVAELQSATRKSTLPEQPDAVPGLDQVLAHARLHSQIKEL